MDFSWIKILLTFAAEGATIQTVMAWSLRLREVGRSTSDRPCGNKSIKGAGPRRGGVGNMGRVTCMFKCVKRKTKSILRYLNSLFTCSLLTSLHRFKVSRSQVPTLPSVSLPWSGHPSSPPPPGYPEEPYKSWVYSPVSPSHPSR